jgi:hypothetical protein
MKMGDERRDWPSVGMGREVDSVPSSIPALRPQTTSPCCQFYMISRTVGFLPYLFLVLWCCEWVVCFPKTKHRSHMPFFVFVLFCFVLNITLCLYSLQCVLWASSVF